MDENEISKAKIDESSADPEQATADHAADNNENGTKGRRSYSVTSDLDVAANLRPDQVEALLNYVSEMTPERIINSAEIELQELPSKVVDKMQDGLRDGVQIALKAAQNRTAQVLQAVRAIIDSVDEARAEIDAFIGTEAFQEMSKYFVDLENDLNQNEEYIFYYRDIIRDIDTLLIAFKDYFYAFLQSKSIKEITLYEFVEQRINAETGQKEQTLLELFSDFATTTPITTPKRAEKMQYMLDKMNNNMWVDLLGLIGAEKGQLDGQLAFKMAKDKSGKQTFTMLSFDFSDLKSMEISKNLTAFDKRVYLTISALYNAGNDIITPAMIHVPMGNRPGSKPSQNQIDKIWESVTKMMRIFITINNEQIKKMYPDVEQIYDGYLLPCERVRTIINGNLADYAIRLFREPPAMTFAKQLNQYTTFSPKLLQSPLNKTDQNLQIEDYLLRRISGAKSGSITNEILLDSLYKETGIKTRMQKQRAPEKIKVYLDYYKQQGYIKSYKLTEDRVIVRT